MSYIEDIRTVASLQLSWEKLSGCNILVTGATGLIGSCLIEVLMERKTRNYVVYAMGRNMDRMETLFGKYIKEKDFHTLSWDITTPMFLTLSFHYIIHAASGAAPVDFLQHPVEVMKANIYGVANLMEYGLVHGMKRFLFVSSGEIYGEGDGRVFVEDYSGYVNCTSPRACYPSSKRAAESLCISYSAEHNVDVVIARPCHVYGPNFTETDDKVYAQFIRNVLNGKDIVMKSTGEQLRSWCYVVDCVSAILHILLKGEKGHAYNVADNNSNITIKELAEIIAELGNRKVIIDIPSEDEKTGFNVVTKSVFNTEKLERLGWNPSTEGIRCNLKKTIEELQRRNSIE